MKQKSTFLKVVMTLMLLLGVSNAWGETATYVKVTSAPTDWSGDYLIVYETGKVAFNGSLTTLDAVSNGIAVTITDNKISLDTKYQFTISASSTSGEYYIQSASGYYIWGTSSNGLSSNNSLSSAKTNTIAYSSGTFTIKGKSGSKTLSYNNASDQNRFRYLGSTLIALYKKQSSTPDKVLSSIAISGTPTMTTYEIGETFEPAGLTVTGTYSDSSTDDLTDEAEWTFDPATFTSTSQTSVSVTATVSGKTSEAYSVNGLLVKVSTSKTLSFNFKTHPTGWPSKKADAAAGNYTYNINGTDYSFSTTKSGDGIYLGGTSSSSGYLMIAAGNQLGLPAIQGYKLAKVVGQLNGSGTPSTTSVVAVVDEDNETVSGGTGQTWDQKGGEYTYNLMGTEQNTSYYLSVSNKNCQVINLTLTYEKVPQTQTVKISDAGWATACLPFNATITSDNATAYYVTGISGTTIGKTEAHVIPAGTGILLKSNDGSEANVTFTQSIETADPATGNMLKGSLTGETFNESGYTYYILSTDVNDENVGFYWDANSNYGATAKCAQYKAVLAVTTGAGAPSFFTFDDATAINGISSVKTSGVRYNLNGQAVGEDYKGIVIVNGKKMFNK